MRRIILLTALMFFCAIPAFAQISQVHHINVRGSEYNVTDVRSHSRKYQVVGEKSLTLNTIAINKDGDQIQGYPLTVKVSELTKADLKAIPDNRPLQERHPFRHFFLVQGPNIVLTAISMFKG